MKTRHKRPCFGQIISLFPLVHGDHNFTITVALLEVTLANLKLAQLCPQNAKAEVTFDPVCHDVLQNSSVYPGTIQMQGI